jgi:polar amino acid transport system substrate-binding protein
MRAARAWAGAAVAAALLAGCGTAAAGSAPLPPVPVPSPPSSVAPPSGSPAPVLPPTSCPASAGGTLASVPAMSVLPKPGHMPAGTTMAAIQNRGFLLAGVDQDAYGFGYRNPDPDVPPGQSYLGYDIDVLHVLAYAIFGNPDAIRFVPVAQDFRIGAADQGIVDLVADSITITCSRSLQVHFSINYFNAYQALLVPKDNETIHASYGADHIPRIYGMDGEKVCTIGTTTSVANLTALARADGFTVIVAGNWSDCLALMQQGDVQAFSTDDTILGGLAAEDPDLKLAPGTFSYEPHGLAFPLDDRYSPGDRELISFTNAVLLRMESSAGGYCPVQRLPSDASCWAALYRRWIQPQLGGPIPAPPRPDFAG